MRTETNLSTPRRTFLRGMAGLAGITALAACTVTKTGNVTTITLNTAEVLDYGDSVLSFAQAGIGLTFVASAIGVPGVAIAEAAITALKTALAAFNTAAGGKATVSYDDTSAKTAFDSVVASVKTINTYIVATITATVSDSTIVTEAKTAANAASGIISAIQGLVDSLGLEKRVGATLKAQSDMAEIRVWLKTRTR